jgi:parvulin-like peptidyl-prolyl isomerase
MKYFILFALCISLSPAKDKIVATVNGKDIYLQELREYYQQNLLTPSNRTVTMKSSLEELINREISIQKAKKKKLAEKPVIRKKLDDVLFHAQVSDDLENRLLKIGTVSDSEVKSYYNKNKEYRTSHILLRLTAFPTPEEVAAANATAINIIKELQKDPKKWDTFVKKYSQSGTAVSSGDLGYQPPIGYVPEYFKAINGQKTGKIISNPVRTQFGVHVIKVTGVRPYDQINKTLYKKIIYDMRRDKILNEYFSSQRNSAKVKINEQYLQ